MFPKSFIFALLALSISVEAIPNVNRANTGNRLNTSNKAATSCAAPKTVTAVQTVTVTARGGAATAVATSTGKNNNAATTTKATGTTTKATGTTTKATGTNTNSNPQTLLTLDPRVIASGFANNGQDIPTAGQVASLTSTNNFINFCLTRQDLPITNGKQITTGSCNPAPIGLIPSTDNMPSSKFAFPQNFATIKAGQTFTIQMKIANMQTGAFVNAQENYFAAPQQLNGAGQIIGHSHVVIEQLTSLTQTTPTDPKKFAFFKGLNAAAVNGVLTADVTNGLAAGFYKLSSINTAANHQPAIVPVAQHGSLDDAIYFTVTASGQATKNGNNVASATTAKAAAATTTAKAVASTTTAKAAATTTKASKKNGQKRRALNRL